MIFLGLIRVIAGGLAANLQSNLSDSQIWHNFYLVDAVLISGEVGKACF